MRKIKEFVHWFYWDDGQSWMTIRGLVANIVLVASAFACAVGIGVPAVARHYDRGVCRNTQNYINQPTVFAEYGYWSWDCLTLVDGQYVSADDYKHVLQLRGLGGK